MDISRLIAICKWYTNQWSAILIGVVRHDVNTSAGNSALCGRVSCASQAASKMQSLDEPEEQEEPEVFNSCR